MSNEVQDQKDAPRPKKAPQEPQPGANDRAPTEEKSAKNTVPWQWAGTVENF